MTIFWGIAKFALSLHSFVTELTTQESRRIDAFVTHWLAALPPGIFFKKGVDFTGKRRYNEYPYE